MKKSNQKMTGNRNIGKVETKEMQQNPSKYKDNVWPLILMTRVYYIQIKSSKIFYLYLIFVQKLEAFSSYFLKAV